MKPLWPFKKQSRRWIPPSKEEVRARAAKPVVRRVVSVADISNLITQAAIRAAAPGDHRPLERRLQEALDQGALVFIELLKSDAREKNEDGSDGALVIDIKTRMELFKLAKDWFATRSRHADDAPGDPQGIEAYKKQLKAGEARKSVGGRLSKKAIERKKREAEAQANPPAEDDREFLKRLMKDGYKTPEPAIEGVSP